ncbi:MAG TPA: glycosyltransferase family 4 protein [Patescibacteria group bacterium]|nr:glycosyltransferase family 4 protein [Patescibacteria group bacterium]
MVVHAYYDEDPRVRREAEALVVAGHQVDVFALRRDHDLGTGTVAGVSVRRLGVQRHQGAGIAVYLREYLSFLVRSGWALTIAHRRRRYGLVQVHSLPDFLVVAALPLRLVGVPVVLDLHEAMPEFFRSRFPGASNRVAHRLLLIQERLSIAFASAVLTVNTALAERLRSLGVRPAKVHVVPNSAALGRFDRTAAVPRSFAADGVVRLVYAGALTPTYELDVVLDGLARIARQRPGLAMHLDVYGRGDAEPALRQLAVGLGLGDRVTFHGRIAIDDVPAAMAAADIGLAPTRHDQFTDVSLSTKLFEYAAMGKPVVATRLPLVEATFPEETIQTYAAGDPDALAAAVLQVIDRPPAERSEAVERTLAIVRDGSWEGHALAYVRLVESLIRGEQVD